MPALQTVQPNLYRIPLQTELTDSTHGTMTAFEVVTVRLRDAEGAEGVGYTFTCGTNGSAIHATFLHDLAPRILGQDADCSSSRRIATSIAAFVRSR